MATENKVLNTRIKLKRDTSANWTSNNPVLLNGEIIIVDTADGEVRFKIGDGSKTYTQLPFEDEGVRNLIADKSKITVETWNDSSGSTAQFLNELVINKVKDRQTYEEMVDAGKVDTNELYFIEEDDEIAITAHATTGTKIATITIGNEATDIYAPPGGVTSITTEDGISSDATTGDITLTNSGVRSIVQDSIDGHKLTIDTGGNSTTITIPDNNTDTTYSAGTGLALDGTTFNHSNSITAGTASGSTSQTLAYGGKFTIPTVTYDAQGHITGSGTTEMTMPAKVTAADLGLSAAMKFIGAVDTLPESGVEAGNVVLYENKEYVWDGDSWVELGDEGSHALKTITISAGNGLTGGGTLEANRTISHGDTSNVSNLTADGRKYITGLTFDDYGHVTGYTTGTETVTAPSVGNGTLTIQKNGTNVATFTANQSVGSTANITVPTKISELTNDSGFITSYTETDPTVPAWAKATNKPSYTAEEVGAVKKTGDKMTGSLKVTVNATTNGYANISANNNEAIFEALSDNDTSRRYLSLRNNNYTSNDSTSLHLVNSANNSDYVVLHTGNKNLITPSDIGAVSKSGDTITGNLYVKTATGATLGLSPESTGLQIQAYSDWNKRKFLWIPSDLSGTGYNKLQWVDLDTTNGKNGRFDIYHTGNKPTAADVGARENTWVPSKSDCSWYIDWFDRGTSIPSGDDLNTYTTPGRYYANTEDIVKSLVNCPTSSNFAMFVFKRTSSSSVNQMITTRTGLYLRGTNSSGTWSEWANKVSKSTVEELIAAITAADVGAVAKAGDTMTGRLTVPQLAVSDHSTPVEIGKYIDFHTPDDAANTDYASRLLADSDGKLYIMPINQTQKEILHTGNIGSQSVNYATSAGSANAVAWGNVSGKPSTYTPPTASSTTLGGVKVGSNISVSSGTISLTKKNVTDALGYTPPTTDTNTDTNVTQSASTTSSWRPILSHNAYAAYGTDPGTATGQTYYQKDISLQPSTGSIKATSVYGAVWNDYAEYRETKETIEPGRVVCENGDDTLSLATERLQPGANIVSDTFGFAIGETDECKTPIAVSGRVLVYPYENRESYKPGDAVCAAPNGTVSKMTREEIREYPERIIGTVSAIPSYDTWGTGNVKVNGRIWIKVR